MPTLEKHRDIHPYVASLELMKKYQIDDITIDNHLMGRYCGEVQILKCDLPSDARVNVIGFVHPEYVEALESIDGSTSIRLVPLSTMKERYNHYESES